MTIDFLKFSSFKKGILYQLLDNAYSYEPKYKIDYQKNWEETDDFFYNNLEIADSCGFITTIDKKPVGFICWDPRNIPDYVEIGHNCIISEYKGKRLGQKQLQEAMRIILRKEVQKVKVTTNEKLVPAQKNYESVGFILIGKRENNFNQEYAGKYMDYELIVSK